MKLGISLILLALVAFSGPLMLGPIESALAMLMLLAGIGLVVRVLAKRRRDASHTAGQL